MTNRPQVLHLVDDATPGGVMRVLDHIQTCPLMAQSAQHRIKVVSRKGALPICDADMIVSHLSLNWRRLPALIGLRAHYARTPLIHVEHSYTQAFTALNVPSKLRFFTMLRTSLALFDTVVAVSDAQATWMKQRRLVSADALRVITPAADLQEFRGLAPAMGPSRVIGAIGRLHAQKGFDILIRAFRQLPHKDVSLKIYGTGPEETALRALAQGDPRIHFSGHTAHPAQAMLSVNIVAIPSRWEAFGLVALEARAAGRPIICSSVDGLTASAGPSAVFVPDLNENSWKNALGAAISTSTQTQDRDRAADCERLFASAWSQLVADYVGHCFLTPFFSNERSASKCAIG